MITVEELLAIPKDDLPQAAKTLKPQDIPQLVEWLSVRDDSIRYQAFLLLQNRSALICDVYPFWDTLREKLSSENSYQRSIGLMLLAENARWDTEGRMEAAIDEYLTLLKDEKPVTVRQCIQSLGKIAECQPALCPKILHSLLSFDLMAVRETMRKSILLDIIHVLLTIRKTLPAEEAEAFILNALSGEILDKKSKKQMELEWKS